LNYAYPRWKNPVTRIEYLLQLGRGHPEKAPPMRKTVPPSLLEEVFALNEELDEVRDIARRRRPGDQLRARLERARMPIDASARLMKGPAGALDAVGRGAGWRRLGRGAPGRSPVTPERFSAQLHHESVGGNQRELNS